MQLCFSYPIAIAMLSSGAVDLKPMITHRFPLEDAVQAFQVAKDPHSGSMKVMIKCAKPLSQWLSADFEMVIGVQERS